MRMPRLQVLWMSGLLLSGSLLLPWGDRADRGDGPMNNKKTNYQLKCGYVKPLRNGC